MVYLPPHLVVPPLKRNSFSCASSLTPYRYLVQSTLNLNTTKNYAQRYKVNILTLYLCGLMELDVFASQTRIFFYLYFLNLGRGLAPREKYLVNVFRSHCGHLKMSIWVQRRIQGLAQGGEGADPEFWKSLPVFATSFSQHFLHSILGRGRPLSPLPSKSCMITYLFKALSNTTITVNCVIMYRPLLEDYSGFLYSTIRRRKIK